MHYTPPELCDDTNTTNSFSIDVWAIGIMFYAMLFGYLPFNSKETDDLKNKIMNEKFHIPNDVAVTDMAKELLHKMLDKDPAKRLELIDFVQSDYYNIDDFDFKKLVDQI